jgi:hypothetical protein
VMQVEQPAHERVPVERRQVAFLREYLALPIVTWRWTAIWARASRPP